MVWSYCGSQGLCCFLCFALICLPSSLLPHLVSCVCVCVFVDAAAVLAVEESRTCKSFNSYILVYNRGLIPTPVPDCSLQPPAPFHSDFLLPELLLCCSQTSLPVCLTACLPACLPTNLPAELIYFLPPQTICAEINSLRP